MKAAVWYGNGDIRIEEIPEPEIKYDELLVKTKAVGICGSELHAYEGKSERRKPPLIMGHEFAGEVTKVGGKVKDIYEGDRVVIEPIIRCGICEQCTCGRSNICNNMQLIGLHRSGAFAEFVAVPAVKCYKIPDNVSFEEASMVEPFSVGIHAVNLASININDRVAIVGDGIIGLAMLQTAKLAGALEIFVVGHHDYRLNLAKRLGANEIINSKIEDPVDKIMKITHAKGVDKVLEAVGNSDSVKQSLKIVKKGGVVTLVGMLLKSIELEIMDVVTKEIEIRGSYGYNSKDFETALTLISTKKLNAKPFITHVIALDDIKRGFEIFAKRSERVIKVLIKP